MNLAPIDLNPLIGAIVPIVAALAWLIQSTFRKQSKIFDATIARNDELMISLNAANLHNVKLAETNRELRADVTELRKQVDKLELELVGIRQTREAERMLFDQRSIEYQTQIAGRDHTIAGLQDRINNMRTEIVDFQKQLRAMTDRLNQVGNDYERVVSERDLLRTEKERMESEIRELQADLKAVGVRNGELEEKVRVLRDDLDKIQRPVAVVDSVGFDLLKEARRKFETDQLPKLTPSDTGDDAA